MQASFRNNCFSRLLVCVSENGWCPIIGNLLCVHDAQLMCIYCCTDDRDDGMGLPIQLPPTDDERATMCICKPPSPSLNFTVMFNANSYSGDEADGVIAVTVIATGVSSEPYTVAITPSERLPVSARELFDYLNETILVTFNPGETEKTVFIIINPDCTREGSEFFDLNLSLDPAAMDLGITLGDPSMAVAEIRDTDSKQRIVHM